MNRVPDTRTPAFKLFLAIIVGLVLTIPLFSVWLLVYDRQTQSPPRLLTIFQAVDLLVRDTQVAILAVVENHALRIVGFELSLSAVLDS